MYLNEIDRRVVFVCESPGPSGKGTKSTAVKRCWAETHRDKRFQEVLVKYKFQNCYITNTVKCGARQGKRHKHAEIEACIGFLLRELELIQPMIAVGVGGNAMHTLRTQVVPKLTVPPVLFQITHYSMRGDPRKIWDREFPKLARLLSRLKPRSGWES